MCAERLTGNQEDNVLCLLCWDERHAATVLLKLSEACHGIKLKAPQVDSAEIQPRAYDLFSTRAYRKIAKTAIEYLERYRAPPRLHLRDMLEDALKRGDEGTLIGRAIDAMDRLHRDMHPDYILSELEDFLRARRVAMIIDNASDALAEGRTNMAEELLHQVVPSRSESRGFFLHDTDLSLDYMTIREEDTFSSGVAVLDQFDACPKRGAMFLFIAAPKRGKSWFLVNVGKHALLRGHTLAHISLENSANLTAQRYTQALLGMTKKEAKTVRVPSFNMDKETGAVMLDEKSVDALAATAENRGLIVQKLSALRRRARLRIEEFPMSYLTVGKLNAWLDMMKQTEDFTPDMLIIDYPDLMALDTEHVRVDTGRTFRDLRGLAQQRDCALVVVTQGNRSSEKARVLTSGMVAEDWSKIMTADVIVTYNQTVEERKRNLARLLVDGARGDRDKFMVLIAQMYEIGQFCLDSTYMSDEMREQVDHVNGDGG